MNIVNKLTLRTLKENKKRTFVTIIGVIISVAMITAVATLVVSFMDLLQRQEISDNGEWHVLYKDVNEEQLEKIKNDDQSEQVILSNDIGYANLEGGQNKDKPYLFVKAYNHAGFKHFPIELKDGRLPTSPNEVVISQHIEDNGGVSFEVGETITMDVGTRIQNVDGVETELNQSYSYIHPGEDGVSETLINKENQSYKIVGVIERPSWEMIWSPGYTVITFLEESLISETNTVNASVILNKVNRRLFDHANELGTNIGIENIQFNKELLRYYGVVEDDSINTMLVSLAAILMVIIMTGSVSLIYNAFAISVSERSRYLGMLSSVGATKRQKRNSVFFEGAVIGVVSIPIGIIAGLVGIGITFYYINTMLAGGLGVTEELKVVLSPLSLAIAVFVSILTIFISTYIPAIRASKISAIDAIRQTKDVKLTGKGVKTSKFVRKVFGIEAEIGLKNLKRNKRRYIATVFSLVISIVLFLSVSYFTSTMKSSYDMTQNGPDFDIFVSYGNSHGEVAVQDLKNIASLVGVTESIIMQDINLLMPVNDAQMPDGVRKTMGETEGEFLYTVDVHALDDQSLKEYANQIGVDFDQLVKWENFPAIVIDTINYLDFNTGQYIKEKGIHSEVGDKLAIQFQDWNTGEKNSLEPLEVIGLTDQKPMGLENMTYPGSLHVIVSENTFSEWLSNQKNIIDESTHRLYLNSTDPIGTEEAIDKMSLSNQPHVYNVYQRRVQDEQLMTIMQVFIYGFVVLISAISVANIFNTISTSIALRKREFAMLKSVGMTPKGFNKMLNYESIFYGIKALFYGLPISFGLIFLMFLSFRSSFMSQFEIPWVSIFIVFLGVFIIVGLTMLYSSSKVKKENIIDALKQENI